MSSPLATIAFVPREVFCTTRRSLESVFERTTEPFELICVDGGSPPEVQAYLEQAARRYDFTLLRTEHYLTPTQARNLAAARVQTPYVVFVDNDVSVSQGWLEPLINCAEETRAWVVGPLYFEHTPEDRLHMAGGVCEIRTDANGDRYYFERHNHAHQLISNVDEPLVRHETELVEYHTVLVSMRFFQKLGPLDEQILSHAEHADLCLTVRQEGERVFLEPASRITYIPPRRLEPEDREFFFLRWSEAWCEASLQRFIEKWDLALDHAEVQVARKWLRSHRRYGSKWLPRLRRVLGPKLTNSLQKRGLNRWEEAINRRRYPPAKFGRPATPQVRVAHAPTASKVAA